MNKKYTFGILAVVLITLAGTFAIAAPFGDDSFGNKGIMDEETRLALHESIENDDYETWNYLKQAQLTTERFEEVKQRHTERAEMREARAELRDAIENADESERADLIKQLQDSKPELAGKGMRQNMPEGGCPLNN
jgi:hypothetical protein